MKQTVNGFEREVKFIPAYSLGKELGRHNMVLWFCLRGEKGGVTLNLDTHWHLRQDIPSLIYQLRYPFKWQDLFQPEGTNISYHSRTRLDEWDTKTEDCKVTDGDCYCSGGTIYAEEWQEGFVAGGEDWLWPRLEQYYRSVFEGEAMPDLTPVYRTE